MCHIKYRQRLLTKTGHVMLQTDHLLRPGGGGLELVLPENFVPGIKTLHDHLVLVILS